MKAEELAKTLCEIESDMSRINDPLEPLKVASALKSEILKYEFLKANKPDDISPLDYTIMKALMIQVPTVPKKCNRIYPEGQYECPNCGCGVTEVRERNAGAFGTMPYIVKLPRCCNCGQVISWRCE